MRSDWVRLSGRDEHELVEVPPTHCPAGHELKGGTVLVGGGDVAKRTYQCQVCGRMIVRLHEKD